MAYREPKGAVRALVDEIAARRGVTLYRRIEV